MGAEAGKHVLELESRLGAVRIGPDADIPDDRGVLGLAEVGRTGQKREPAVAPQIEALEKAEAEGVIAGQVIHAFLLKHQQAVEPL